MWDASRRHLQRAQELALRLRELPGADGEGLPPVFSGYHCVTFGNMLWIERLKCLQRVAQHVIRQTTRPFIAVGTGFPLRVLQVTYMSSDFAAHTTGANILGLFRR